MVKNITKKYFPEVVAISVFITTISETNNNNKQLKT